MSAAPKVGPLKIEPFRCPECRSTLLHAFMHEGQQAFECTSCGHWGTLAWGFQQTHGVDQRSAEATASSEPRKGSLEKREEIPADREKTVAQVSPASIKQDAARYRVLQDLADECMLTIEMYVASNDGLTGHTHREQRDLLSATDVDSFCDALIAEQQR